MIRIHRRGEPGCRVLDAPFAGALDPDVLWIDLVAPTREEELSVETALGGLPLPTREEMAAIEASSRFYRERGATYVTVDLLHRGDEEVPFLDPVTFVVTPGPLVTIRYFEPRPFAMLEAALERDEAACSTAPGLALHLFEMVIDRTSDVLSRSAARVQEVGEEIFAERGRATSFEPFINRLGRARLANARLEQSLAGLMRAFVFLGLDDRVEKDVEARDHLASLTRDARSLTDHNHAVAASVDFQLNAALGLINIQQSSIIKIFSVAAVAFLPPTLIASIYGMNFDHMPELAWPWAYPAALVAMVVSAILPLAWFRKRGWL
ncbi:MAG: magnesium transporter CorA family protein [Alphaproteobacteria bacterium]|nr:magnesium transporter CorA family protein [Alphaproteobacteria bacterium]MBU1526074.1 magnesium transporter CorA family protein [Alphaproteobacteria bacterium]MBU2116867.1 magnesium transporter CorA family protein [Alphaproteobacteria bacterium]MBU2350613.1 magnesium transporter CorA family protein [Alphaproteobacteria bacterium]MBU2382247.1 magnesium transporter CorA family protein [Alphaproteobacteria bacterium]